MEEKLNLYQKLAKIGELVDVVAKNKAGFNYKYTDITDILAKVKHGMKKYSVSLIPTIVPGTMTVEPTTFVKTKVDRNTKQPYDETKVEMVVKADTNMRWIDNEDPESYIDIPWSITGCQDVRKVGLGWPQLDAMP